jgi:hypothetical protein
MQRAEPGLVVPVILARATILTVAAGTLLGCAATGPPPAPIERSREVAGTPDAVRQRVEAKLQALGFALPQAAGAVAQSGNALPAWADCETIITSGGSNSSQKDFARPESRSASVAVRYSPVASGTRVDVDAMFGASYHHRFRAMAFTEACASTGELERALLAAAG